MCLLDGDRLVSALAVERITRVKRAVVSDDMDHRTAARVRAGYLGAIKACCDAANIRVGDISQFSVASPDSHDEAEIAENTALLSNVLPQARAFEMPHPEHHLAHAYSAFFPSGWESAAALVADSFGTPVNDRREEHSAFHFQSRDQVPTVVLRHLKPDSCVVPKPRDDGWVLDRTALSGIGEIYRFVTILLGFFQPGTKFDDAGKTMGLAPYGARLSDDPVLLRPSEEGTIDCSGALAFLESRNLVTRTRDGLRLSVRHRETPLSQFHRDLAAQVQWELERAAVHIARYVREQTNEKRLVLAGGVFLNAVVNRRIVEEAGFDDVYIFPAATDDGTAVGAAYYAYQRACQAEGSHATSRRLHSLGVGPCYQQEDIDREVARWPVESQRLPSLDAAAEEAGQRIARGEIVGWFQGGSELGPRALGYRSILADPRDPHIKDVLNERVKFREGFRPFAPAVLERRVHEFFEVDKGESLPFMLQIVGVRPEFRDQLRGITHVNGTARVQTVGRDENPLYHRVIEAYAEHREFPIIVNTSFNLKGMPIVESPRDALSCFVSTEMDALVIGQTVVFAPDRSQWVPQKNPRVEASALGHLGTNDLELRVRLGDVTLSNQVYTLLRAIDGRRTIGDLAKKFEVENKTMLRRVLALFRRKWCNWTNLPE